MTRIQPTLFRPHVVQLLFLLACVTLSSATALSAQPADSDPFGTSGRFGGVADRENTRLMGTVFDSSGNPMSDVLIWVVNDAAPAEQARSRTRKTGNYLVRGMASLYTEQDVYGITARARFEKEGYQTVVARMSITKNGVERMYPILLEEGGSLDIEGECAMLVGSVVNKKGKGVKGAVVEVRAAGEVLASTEPTKKDGEFEVLLWDVPIDVEVIATSKGVETKVAVELQPSPQPNMVLAQRINLVVD